MESLKIVGIVVGVLLLFTLVFAYLVGMGSAGRYAGVVIEREIYEQSYQKQQGYQTEIATNRAALASINSRLATETDPGIIRNLKAQRAAIEIQIQSVR